MVQTKRRRILSIQSHVTRDYVGNKAAVLPLQLLGYNADSVNTVNFSSVFIHDGSRTDGNTIRDILNGVLKACVKNVGSGVPGAPFDCDLTPPIVTDYRYLLSGYIGSVDCLKEVIQFAKTVKAGGNPTFQWFCDPVLGDNGTLYMDPQLVDTYVKEALPIADIISPNHYELQWLCGEKELRDVKHVYDCCRKIHAIGPKVIVVTSVLFPDNPNSLTLVGSSVRAGEEGPIYEQFDIPFPRKDMQIYGTGDLTAALLAAAMDRGTTLEEACRLVLSLVQDVLDYTIKADPKAYCVDVVGAQDLIRELRVGNASSS